MCYGFGECMVISNRRKRKNRNKRGGNKSIGLQGIMDLENKANDSVSKSNLYLGIGIVSFVGGIMLIEKPPLHIVLFVIAGILIIKYRKYSKRSNKLKQKIKWIKHGFRK